MIDRAKFSTPMLQGGGVRLEPMTEAHLPALERVAFREPLWRYMLIQVRTIEDLREWMKTAFDLERAGSVMPWVTVRKSDGQVVGVTRLMDLDWQHETVEIGWTWLLPEVHGTGINAEAKLLQLRYVFEVLGLRRGAFKTHHENLQSQAALRKLGAVGEGTFRNHYLMPDGSQRHSVWFSVTREDWPALRLRLEERVAGSGRGQPQPSV